jgi:hypothetical protein
MRLTILQPNYIPWRGYFDFFKQSDAFVVYDDVQYTKNDWRNRNLIKTPDGAQWMTIPVDDNKRIAKNLLIKDVKIINNGWQARHIKTLEMNYARAPYFGEVMDIMRESFDEDHTMLCPLVMTIIRRINEYLGLRCKIYYSSELGFADLHKTDRVVAICKHLKATEYLSGDAAKDYLELDKFGDIRVLWHRYKEKEYPQLHGQFISRISILDLLMNCGLKGFDLI